VLHAVEFSSEAEVVSHLKRVNSAISLLYRDQLRDQRGRDASVGSSARVAVRPASSGWPDNGFVVDDPVQARRRRRGVLGP
jgi:hypothetical protein